MNEFVPIWIWCSLIFAQFKIFSLDWLTVSQVLLWSTSSRHCNETHLMHFVFIFCMCYRWCHLCLFLLQFFEQFVEPHQGPFTGFTSGIIYKGYMDDPSNTDNAWREAEVWNFHYHVPDNLDSRIVHVSLICMSSVLKLK